MSNDKTSKNHDVTEFEHLFRIAQAEGFRTGKPIWDTPENAEIKRIRVNPNTLAIDDVLVIPELDPKVQSAATDKTHLFTLAADELLLNLRLQNEARKPLAERDFTLVVGTGGGSTPTSITSAVTTKQGELSDEIPTLTTEAELTLPETIDGKPTFPRVIHIIVGALEPANTVRGQQMRLNNMGYFAGFTVNDTEQIKWAIEEFQHDHGIKPPTGRSDDKTTFNRIAHEHGDLLASETVP